MEGMPLSLTRPKRDHHKADAFVAEPSRRGVTFMSKQQEAQPAEQQQEQQPVQATGMLMPMQQQQQLQQQQQQQQQTQGQQVHTQMRTSPRKRDVEVVSCLQRCRLSTAAFPHLHTLADIIQMKPKELGPHTEPLKAAAMQRHLS